MKIQSSYKTLEHEIKERKDKLTAKTWRGDLSKKGIDNASWGDLNYIQDEVLNKQDVK